MAVDVRLLSGRGFVRGVWRGVAVCCVVGGALLGRSVEARQDVVSGPVEPVGETEMERGWRVQEVTRGLMRPWGIAWLPGGTTALVTEREGRLRVVEDGRLRMDPVEGVPEVFAVNQGGLLDLVIHPEFAENRRIYFTASTGNNRANRTVLFRAEIDEGLGSLRNVEEIFRVNTNKSGSQHFGSRLLWLGDGSLLMSVGDGGNPPLRLDGEFIREKAQDVSSHLGKVLRMDGDGRPMADNPFVGEADVDPYIFTLGHRNIQGMALHPETGAIWASEHGSRGGDELNVLVAGGNYGWPEATYSREYYGPRITEKTTKDGMIDPEVVWTPAIAPSGLAFYTGEEFAGWRGDLLAGGLVQRQIRRVIFEDGEIVGQTTLQFEDRIRWVGMGPDGGVYFLTDEVDGGLFRIVRDGE